MKLKTPFILTPAQSHSLQFFARGNCNHDFQAILLYFYYAHAPTFTRALPHPHPIPPQPSLPRIPTLSLRARRILCFPRAHVRPSLCGGPELRTDGESVGGETPGYLFKS